MERDGTFKAAVKGTVNCKHIKMWPEYSFKYHQMLKCDVSGKA
jgi:hypothetical protein